MPSNFAKNSFIQFTSLQKQKKIMQIGKNKIKIEKNRKV
jgi:hypothetical protein